MCRILLHIPNLGRAASLPVKGRVSYHTSMALASAPQPIVHAGHIIAIPPLMCKVWPVTYAASSLAR